MNITQLKAFTMVVEHGSFSAAARAMQLSQPAVTMQIQALEADLGARLLDRMYRRVELTEAGEALLPLAKRVLSDMEAAREAVGAVSGSVTGHLLLAASTTPGQYILPNLLGSFLKEYPKVGVSIDVRDTAQVVAAVESGEAHIGMTGAEVADAKVEFEQMGTDEIVLIAPPDHEFAKQGSATGEELARAAFIMREEGSGTRQVTEHVLRDSGVEPDELHVVTELGTSEAIVSAVEGGMGVGVVSRWMSDKAVRLGTVVEVGAEGFPARRPLFVVKPRGTLTRAAEAFLGHLQANLQG
ncbi:MAG: selenium metabolism-associated LysR family transcriptional regulator [Coriobacteriia bacterium]|nr:selenium metabolism-associated LysR family transcriptional regulator [Coriobacteriia bacterium]